ncbi:MAG TPA: hypothetical protein VLX68_12635 [Chitinivibrionales bacterium]|nr:hypothetical protein [Chitinivibrionales bacterium]
MQTNTHGMISLFLIFMAIAVALGAVVLKSPLFALIYLGICAICFLNIVFSYCAKCPCREKDCSHGFLGSLTKIMPKRKEGPYTFIDILSTLISIGAILMIPHLWLVYNIPSLILFWLLIIVAALEIIFLVCPDCANKNCYLCPGKSKSVKKFSA